MMLLNIAESQRIDGTPGTGGTSGANGTDANPNGGAGGNGQPGAGVSLGRDTLMLTGDPGGDRVTFELQAVGGSGGSGSLGGAGKGSSATVTFTNSPGSSLTEAVYGATGAGGAAGSAGAAGMAEVSYTNLDIDLAGSLGTQNSLRLWGVAWGGNGGSGGSSGGGGSSGYTGLSSTTTLGPPAFTSTNSQLGTPGGAAPDGADGGAGATATVRFDDISVLGQNNQVALYGTTIGGGGGSGGSGSRGGSGSAGAPGGNGGDGGDGVIGLSEVTRLDVQTTGGLNLIIYLDARGGQGSQGGGGGNGESGRRIDSNSTNGVGGSLDTTIYAANGQGGDGGDGGRAVARVADSNIDGSDAIDYVAFFMRASGGLGGPGGFGGFPGVASSTSTSGSSVVSTSVVQGIPAGTKGADGSGGRSLVEIRNTTVDLAGGDDRVSFDLLAKGPGADRVIVSGNHFDGGLGTDRLTFGTGKADEPRAVVNVEQGFFRLGKSPVDNTMSGFEVFVGTLGADRFIDGKGDQTYSGGAGADRFVFSKTGSGGHDRIEDFAADDVIRLAGFGQQFDSFTKIMMNIMDMQSGALLTTGTGNDILLVGVAKASLTAGDFIFP